MNLKYQYINGRKVSKIQIKIFNLLNFGVLNYRINNYALDIAIPEAKIAIEYDGWYWHEKLIINKNNDNKKRKFLIENGWKILYIRSKKIIPTKQEILNCLNMLEYNNIIELKAQDYILLET